MNLTTTPNTRELPRTPAATRTSRTQRQPARAFGTGYGNSSGYATERRNTRDWGNAQFRFA